MGSALLSFENELSDSSPARMVLFQGGLLTYHADSTDTSGQFALLEFEGVPGTEPPLHVHRNEDELFFVLEGELKILRGAEEIAVCSGASVFLPREIPHTFKILSKSARFLVCITPGGFEDYFRDLGQPVGAHAGATSEEPASIAEMIRVAARYSLTFMP